MDVLARIRWNTTRFHYGLPIGLRGESEYVPDRVNRPTLSGWMAGEKTWPFPQLAECPDCHQLHGRNLHRCPLAPPEPEPEPEERFVLPEPEPRPEPEPEEPPVTPPKLEPRQEEPWDGLFEPKLRREKKPVCSWCDKPGVYRAHKRHSDEASMYGCEEHLQALEDWARVYNIMNKLCTCGAGLSYPCPVHGKRKK